MINMDIPESNRYCNFQNIDYFPYEELSELKKRHFYRLIRSHFLQNEGSQYSPTDTQIEPYFEGHNSKCHITMYYADDYLLDSKTKETVPTKVLVGTMTSRPLHVTIRKGYKLKPVTSFDCNYVDYLCVHSSHRKKHIASELIQTHYYYDRRQNKNMPISLFKREGILTGIVPNCVYKSVVFDMITWRKPVDFLPTECNIIECGPTNTHLLFDFMKQACNKFQLTITCEISNFIELMKTGNIYVYLLLENGEICGAYLFRNTCTTIGICNKTERSNTNTNTTTNIRNGVLACFATINDTIPSVFSRGYKVALWKIIENYPDYRYNVLENISDTHIVIDELLKKNQPFLEYPCAYFFYNYICGMYPPNKTLFIH